MIKSFLIGVLEGFALAASVLAVVGGLLWWAEKLKGGK